MTGSTSRFLGILALIFCIAAAGRPVFAAEVHNENVRQEGNRVLFVYDLAGDEEEAEVTLRLTVEGRTCEGKDLHLEGDIGKMKPGRGKRLYWNVLQDFPRGLAGNVDWELTAGRGGGKAFTNTLGMTFVPIPPGSFMMGSPSSESGRDNDETRHSVTITKPFYMQTTEVTQGQWKAIMGSNPSRFTNCGDDCPVEQVSWDDVQEFIVKLNRKEGTNRYRLPTEAEWECACRAGTTTRFYTGDDDSDLARAGWYDNNSGSRTHPVGEKEPNSWGLYDMHGNVWEWCQDRHGGSYRVSRGGSWFRSARYCRSANRSGYGPGSRNILLGFRLAGRLE